MTLADLIGRVWEEAKAIEPACPCKMDITEYLHGSLPRLVRCNYNCACSQNHMSGACRWPGHAAVSRLREALRALVGAWHHPGCAFLEGEGDDDICFEQRSAALKRLEER